MCDVTHSYVSHDSFVCVTWLMHMCDIRLVGIRNMCLGVTWLVQMCASCVWHDSCYMWHDSHICVIWLIHLCDMVAISDICVCVTWLSHMCDMTHSWVCHDSRICVTWLNQMCDVTHLRIWHDAFTCVTWVLWGESDSGPVCVLHMIWFICVAWLINVCAMGRVAMEKLCVCVTWLMHMCDMIHSYVWHDSFRCVR